MHHDLPLALALIVTLGVGGQWLAWWLKIPSILLMLGAGLVAGPGMKILTGTPLLAPDQLLGDLLPVVTSMAVAVILYEGGLSLRLREIREVGGVVRNLVTIGALVSWLLTASLAWALGLVDGRLALLLGALLVVTGPTVIGPLLRQVRPRGTTGAILRWEGIVIDPIGATLAVLTFEALLAVDLKSGLFAAALGLGKTVLVGGAIGAAAAALLVIAERRHALPDHLENPVSLMAVLAAFVAANALQDESGLLAVTAMGMIVANALGEHARHLLEFKENLKVLLIGCLFVVLAARMDPTDVGAALGWRSALFVLALVLVVRPLSVLVSTRGSALSREERLFLACMAPRGIVAAAVSVVFGLRLAEAGYAGGNAVGPLTFVVIMATVAVYGLAAGPIARRLGLSELVPRGILILGAHSWARELGRALAQAGAQPTLVDTNRANVSAGRLEGLRVLHGNVLSERLLEEVDLSALGTFVALTPNDEVNVLAAERLAGLLGRARAYRLPPRGVPGATDPAPPPDRARLLFGPDQTYETLDARFVLGEKLKVTRLTEEFPFERWREQNPGGTPLFLVDARGTLEVATTDHPLQPRPGDAVVALVRVHGDDAPRG